MAFLLSMLSLLITTLYSLILNYNAIDNVLVDPSGHNVFYDYILPKDIYLKVSVLKVDSVQVYLMPILWIDLLITGTFTLGVSLLSAVQIKNFYTGLTTAETA